MPNINWPDEFDPVDQCEDCPHPSGCARECAIESYVHEDVASIRNEVVR